MESVSQNHSLHRPKISRNHSIHWPSFSRNNSLYQQSTSQNDSLPLQSMGPNPEYINLYLNLFMHMNIDSNSSTNSSSNGNIWSECETSTELPYEVWGYVQMVILVTALPANVVLIWLLLKGRTESSASPILSISLTILSLLCIICLTVNIYTCFQPSLFVLFVLSEILCCLTWVGCPFLVVCMCLERCVAVVWPIVYMRANKVRYQITCSALAWVSTFTMELIYFLTSNEIVLLWCMAVYISVIYLLILLCLSGILYVVYKKSMVDHERKNVSVIRKALKSVVEVLVFFSVAYLPTIALLPLMYNWPINVNYCGALYIVSSFPTVAVYISPVFYYRSLLKMFFCQKNSRETQRLGTLENNSGSDVLRHKDVM